MKDVFSVKYLNPKYAKVSLRLPKVTAGSGGVLPDGGLDQASCNFVYTKHYYVAMLCMCNVHLD